MNGSALPVTLSREDLDALAGDEAGERLLIERLLGRFRAGRGAAGAALYLRADGYFRREAVSGDGDFPAALRVEETETPGHVRLGDGCVRWQPHTAPAVIAGSAHRAGADGEPVSDDAPLLLTLALAGRGLRLRRELKEQGFAVNYRGVELEALYDVGLAIASTLDFERLCEEILMRAVSLLDARRGALYLLEAGTLRMHRAFGGGAAETMAIDGPIVARWLIGEESDLGPVGGTAAEILPGARYLLAVPVAIDGAPRGLLVMADRESRQGVGPFRDGDRRTLGLLANQAAIALENANLHRQALEKERLEREIELASEIQRRILPKTVPVVPGFEMAGWNRPARHIGGDYFDFLTLAEGHLGVLVGDVSGKGVPAALLVSTLHSALHLLLDRTVIGPELLARLNQHLLESSGPNKFITLLVAELDPTSGRLAWLNAGHNPGILMRADGSCTQLGPGGVPLGLFPRSTYRVESLTMEPGDLLCLYSDGITEASSPDDVEFGFERLVALLAEQRDASLDQVIATIDARTSALSGGRPQGDDQTVLLLRRRR